MRPTRGCTVPVAVKVLPSALADDAQFGARFEREAKSIAALNHPHICTLHDVGREGGVAFLVMELVQGESLAVRLERGRLPFEQALQTAVEIADALATAHKQGIIHRDLKPGNVMLTKSGAKLLDFGLAKTAQGAGRIAQGPQSMLPTTPPVGGPLTAQGTILGTLQYMAPEQLEGKEADARTDIFAFGALAYEMVTGSRAFEGTSQASLIGAIMHAEPPPLSARQPVSPPTLERLVRTCLAKDPEARWQSARDVARELTEIARTSREPAIVPPLSDSRRTAVAATAIVIALIAGGGIAALMRPTAPLRSGVDAVVRFTVRPPLDGAWRANPGGSSAPLAVSPDGRWIVVGANQHGEPLLWLRGLDTQTMRPLPGTEDGRYPFWSPDSRSIAFFTQNSLKRVDAVGQGSAQVIRDFENGVGGAWAPDGTMIVGTFTEGLHRTNERGDALEMLALDGIKGPEARLPTFLPDGRHFLFLTTSSDQTRGGDLYLAELGSRAVTRLVEDARGSAYASGHVLFVRGDTLVAQPFDERTLSLRGRPQPIAEAVGLSNNNAASFAVSANGVLAYVGSVFQSRQLTVRDRSGALIDRIGGPRPFGTMHLAGDEKRLVTTHQDPRSGAQSLWLMELARRSELPVGDGNNAILSPSGNELVAAGPPPIGLLKFSLNGDAKRDVLIGRKAVWPTDWSRDGRSILLQHPEARTNFDLSVLDVANGTVTPLVQTRADEGQARFSPDGRWIAYASNISGRAEVWVKPFRADGQPQRLSSDGGSEPRWNSNGRELFYLSLNGEVMAVGVVLTPDRLTSESPKPLFTIAATGSSVTFSSSYLPADEGRRFFITERVNEPGENDMSVILNWPAVLSK